MGELVREMARESNFETPFLITARDAILRPLINEDFSRLSEAIKISIANLHMWIPWVEKLPKEGEHYSMCVQLYKEAESGEVTHFVAFHNENFMGMISLHFVDKTERSAVLSYWCRSDFDNLPHFIQAIKCIIQFSFNDWGLEILEIPVVFGNYESEKTAKSIGFSLANIQISGDKPIKSYILRARDCKDDLNISIVYR